MHMPNTTARGKATAALPTTIRLQIVASATKPPVGAGWLRGIKHDGHDRSF